MGLEPTNAGTSHVRIGLSRALTFQRGSGEGLLVQAFSRAIDCEIRPYLVGCSACFPT